MVVGGEGGTHHDTTITHGELWFWGVGGVGVMGEGGVGGTHHDIPITHV